MRRSLIKFNNFCATRALCPLCSSPLHHPSSSCTPTPTHFLSLLSPSLSRPVQPPSIPLRRSFSLLRSFAACLCYRLPRSLSRYKLVARAQPSYWVPQIYDGDMSDSLKQVRSARDFISEGFHEFIVCEASSTLFYFFFFYSAPAKPVPFSVISTITSRLDFGFGETSSFAINHD